MSRQYLGTHFANEADPPVMGYFGRDFTLAAMLISLRERGEGEKREIFFSLLSPSSLSYDKNSMESNTITGREP